MMTSSRSGSPLAISGSSLSSRLGLRCQRSIASKVSVNFSVRPLSRTSGPTGGTPGKRGGLGGGLGAQRLGDLIAQARDDQDRGVLLHRHRHQAATLRRWPCWRPGAWAPRWESAGPPD